jgi:DNA-binding NtrC family response regulator/pSer/pThr/pTyr-binding forkhead associated (FHA) protein
MASTTHDPAHTGELTLLDVLDPDSPQADREQPDSGYAASEHADPGDGGAAHADRGHATEPLSEQELACDTSRYALVIYHQQGAQVALLTQGRALVVGRAAPADIVIAASSLSREHARFRLLGDQVTIEDLGSRNGSWYGGSRVQTAVLRVGSQVSLGGIVVAVQLAPAAGVHILGVESHEAFVAALEEELVRTRYFQHALSIVLLRAADAHVSRFTDTVRSQLRQPDRIGWYSPGVLELLLPETGLADASALAHKIIEACENEQLVASIASFPQSGQTAEQLLGRCKAELQRTSSSGRVRRARTDAFGLEVDLDERDHEGQLVAQSPEMLAIKAQIERLAESSIPVLLLGETGTGKEVVARAIHEQSARAERPLVYVNCAAIPAQLVESLLFGHERGAFTGAVSQQKGVFEAAHGGTLLLDEVGDLPVAAQAVLLRSLETRRIARVGSTREIDVDVRLISATNRDLEKMCTDGAFRWDLLYRLNVMSLTLPPLRTRPEELEALVTRFILRANRANARHVRGVHPEAWAQLRAHTWPGNVRELRNVIERAVVIAEADTIGVADLPERLRPRTHASGALGPDLSPHPLALEASEQVRPKEAEPLVGLSAAEQKKKLCDLEAEMIRLAVLRAGGNQTEAARRMGMPLRTLVRKIAVLGIQAKRR